MYRKDLDSLKGICIISVLLFHAGILKSGYLGVDAFFVINGFLIIPSIVKKIQDKCFSYGDFVRKRLLRLWPLVLTVSLASVVLGCIFLLPYELERVARSAIASNLLSENLRSALTFGNYWEVLNDYSPLFHLWYIGILSEFYVIIPLFFIVAERLTKSKSLNIKHSLYLLWGIFGISLFLYFWPSFNEQHKFYLLPFRMYELILGGLVGIYAQGYFTYWNNNFKWVVASSYYCFLLVLFCSFFNITETGIGHEVIPIAPYNLGITKENIPLPPTFALLSVVLFSSIIISRPINTCMLNNKILLYFGSRCYSLFIWHQFVLAFYRNLIDDDISFMSLFIYICITLAISELSYRYIERIKIEGRRVVSLFALSIILCVPYWLIYRNGGVIHNVPELELAVGEGRPNTAVSYVDVPFKYDKDFPDNNKMNVLVTGNSFARDFCNILLLSKYSDSLNISYRFEDYPISRFIKADYIFTFMSKESVDTLRGYLKPSCKVYGIGTKNWGGSENQIYAKRWSRNYLKTTRKLPDSYVKINNLMKEKWGRYYVDLISPILTDSNRVRVFTDDGKYFSQDCRHLTRAGCEWYAKNIDFDNIFSPK